MAAKFDLAQMWTDAEAAQAGTEVTDFKNAHQAAFDLLLDALGKQMAQSTCEKTDETPPEE